MKMKIYDISMEIKEGMPAYKNKKENKPKIVPTRTLAEGANESKLEMKVHTGTHIDAYFHMLAKGKTIDKTSLEKFIGECIVLDFSHIHGSISAEDFNRLLKIKGFSEKRQKKGNKRAVIKKNDIILLKTRNTAMEAFDFDFTYLDKTGARFLAGKNIKCIGIDNLGIERGQPGHETHKILLERGIPIIEGLELSKIKQGRYFFIGFPLKIKNGDGSPIRAVLIDKKF